MRGKSGDSPSDASRRPRGGGRPIRIQDQAPPARLRLDRPPSLPRPPRWAALLLVTAACSGRSRPDPGTGGPAGILGEKPGGGYFLSDPHQSGLASRVRLLEIGWGRVVDVYDVDERGEANPVPVLRDVVISEDVLSDATDLSLVTNPVTGDSRLVVFRMRAAPDTGSGTFTSILARATSRLGPLVPKNDDGRSAPPFSYVARNATLVLRFDDLLEDGPEARASLLEDVRLTSGYPPVTPRDARIVFDPSHGGIAGGVFHSTRILVDFTVNEREALELPYAVPVNVSGLPASSASSALANASLHLPTALDDSRGQFTRLTNLAGHPLRPEGPLQLGTQDLVRAFRAGGPADTNSGFLLDFAGPRLVGSWDIAVEAAQDDPLGPPGFGFRADVRFRTPCSAAPSPGDTLQLGGELFEVRAPAPAPDPDGGVAGVPLLRLGASEPASAAALVGLGRFLTPYRTNVLEPACWVSFVPPPANPPSEGISEDARVHLRFSEPMDPDSFRAFDSFRLLRGLEGSGAVVRADDLVVGAVRAQQNLQEFVFEPRLPLGDVKARDFRFELLTGATGVRDLAGGELVGTFGQASFRLADGPAPRARRGFGLRFESPDELEPPGLNDLRGQVTYVTEGGLLRPRPVLSASYSADRTNPIPNLMQSFAFGVQTPLSPLGSKLQAIWRYADFGFRVRDESRYNLDVVGLSWAPLGGALVADFFPLFELRLGHARHLPDESHPPLCAPVYPFSGLEGAPSSFASNLLSDPRGQQVVVHPRNLGYRLRPADLFQNERGTVFLPFPWNRSGAPLTSFTWRDTSVIARGGLRGPGVPLDIEVGAPLNLDVGIGSAGIPGRVGTIGLPLLWEVRCFPSAGALGLNALDILLPVPGWPTPNFRAFSTGGVDSNGHVVQIDPDLALTPSGGFNPTSRPPGQPTPLTADNSFYVGQIDTVVRVSRAVTIWIDTGSSAPTYVPPVLEPRAWPGTSSVLAEFRGADGFSPEAGDEPFDAASIDPYGDIRDGTIDYHGDGSWSADIHTVDGARFLQVRFSFLNDVESGLVPELDSFGVAFQE